jgi:hypothetical protein
MMKISSAIFGVILYCVLCFTATAESIQPYEAGVQPIKSRIQAINDQIVATNARLSTADISSEEKQLRLKCLQQYSSEKEQLEADLETGRKINQLPGVMYLSTMTQQPCYIDLNQHSGSTR